VQSGEPDVLVMSRSAEWSSALWDRNRRAVKAALAITDTDKEGRPTGFVVYLSGCGVDLCAVCWWPCGRWIGVRTRCGWCRLRR
jgi:hypothetical protein